MRQKELFKICHGCNNEITQKHHWKVKLYDKRLFVTAVYFHAGCYEHYREQYIKNITWAKELR